jgi:hypothetical protein
MPVGAIAVLLISISATTCFCIGVSAGLGTATIGGGYALTAAQAAVFVAAVFVASASWQTLLADGGAPIGRLVTSRCDMLATALASSLLIGLLALRILSR